MLFTQAQAKMKNSPQKLLYEYPFKLRFSHNTAKRFAIVCETKRHLPSPLHSDLPEDHIINAGSNHGDVAEQAKIPFKQN